MMSAATILVLALVAILPVISGKPVDVEGQSEHFSASSTKYVSSSNGYQVVLSKNTVNDNCTAILTIAGNGIHKKVEYPCDQAPTTMINMNGSLVVGDYFTDKPGELVHLTEDSCTREVFQGEEGKSTSEEEPMGKEECEEVRDKIAVMEEQQKNWEEWFNKQQEETQQQLQELQQQLQEIQQTMFGGIFNFPFLK